VGLLGPDPIARRHRLDRCFPPVDLGLAERRRPGALRLRCEPVARQRPPAGVAEGFAACDLLAVRMERVGLVALHEQIKRSASQSVSLHPRRMKLVVVHDLSEDELRVAEWRHDENALPPFRQQWTCGCLTSSQLWQRRKRLLRGGNRSRRSENQNHGNRTAHCTAKSKSPARGSDTGPVFAKMARGCGPFSKA